MFSRVPLLPPPTPTYTLPLTSSCDQPDTCTTELVSSARPCQPDRGTSAVMAGWCRVMADGSGVGQPLLGPQREEWVTDEEAVTTFREFQTSLTEAGAYTRPLFSST